MFHVKTVYNSKDEGSGLGLFRGAIIDMRAETKSMITLRQNTR